ncbi:MAG: hypothetical protein B6I22_15065 [Desulfobacteraceae bacterium 4572_123]|nr:MAG: hypothetical protein B6I22_15065 [Desulfobacteraceae bacterium 4572_123]
MQNLILLIVIGLFAYVIFSRKGVVGCCDHGAHEPRRHQDRPSAKSADIHKVNIIDLSPDEYTVLSTVPIDSSERLRRENKKNGWK